MKLILMLISVVAMINVAASVVVLRAPIFSSSQRLLQLALIWIVPVIGAVVCVVFASSQAAGQSTPSKMDPLYLPSDGGAPVGASTGSVGCGGGDGGGDCGGGGD